MANHFIKLLTGVIRGSGDRMILNVHLGLQRLSPTMFVNHLRQMLVLACQRSGTLVSSTNHEPRYDEKNLSRA